MQKTSGVYSILDSPIAYNFIQFLFAHKKTAKKFSSLLRTNDSTVVYDIGCGPGSQLEYLEDCEYYGFDIAQEYIDEARQKFAHKPNVTFFCEEFNHDSASRLPEADLVIMSAVMHHLSDTNLQSVFSAIRSKLKPGGRFVTLDPTFVENQNFISKTLVSSDRGKSVRSPKEYSRLIEEFFSIRNTFLCNVGFRTRKTSSISPD